MLVKISAETNVHPVLVRMDPQDTTVETERVRLMAEDNVTVAKLVNELDEECSDLECDSSYCKSWNTENHVDVHTTISTPYLKRPNEDSNYQDSDYEDSD